MITANKKAVYEKPKDKGCLLLSNINGSFSEKKHQEKALVPSR